MHPAEPGIASQRFGVAEIDVGLPRKADDDVSGDRDFGGLVAQGGDERQVIAPAVEATHALEYRVTPGLQRDVEMAAEPGGPGQLDQVGREVIGIDRAEAKARRGDRLQQPPNERREAPSAIAAKGAQVDTG